jgi:hypothetical protein
LASKMIVIPADFVLGKAAFCFFLCKAGPQ